MPNPDVPRKTATFWLRLKLFGGSPVRAMLGLCVWLLIVCCFFVLIISNQVQTHQPNWKMRFRFLFFRLMDFPKSALYFDTICDSKFL